MPRRGWFLYFCRKVLLGLIVVNVLQEQEETNESDVEQVEENRPPQQGTADQPGVIVVEPTVGTSTTSPPQSEGGPAVSSSPVVSLSQYTPTLLNTISNSEPEVSGSITSLLKDLRLSQQVNSQY